MNMHNTFLTPPSSISRSTWGLALLSLTVPHQVFAQTLAGVTGFFNIFVGLVLTVALVTYGIGAVIWIVRLGTWPSYRTEAIKILEWSVVILFVLVVLLLIVQFFRDHPTASSYLIAVVLLALLLWAILALVKQPPAKKEEK